MENQRPLLWIAFGFVVLLMYQAWTRDYGPKPAPDAETATEAPPAPVVEDELPGLPQGAATPAAQPADAATAPGPAGAERVHVVTDVYDIYLDTQGADLRQLDLLSYPVEKTDPNTKVRLMDEDPATLYLLQTGLLGGDPAAAPTHQALWVTGRNEYRLADGADDLQVAFRWSRGDGLTVTKTYTFRRGEYVIGLDYAVTNGASEAWRAAPYFQIKRKDVQPKRGFGTSVEGYSFTGPVFYDGEKYAKRKLKSITKEPINASVSGGWLASIQHHFLAAVIPPADQQFAYTSKVQSGDVYLLSGVGPLASVAPGQTTNFTQTLFIGPKIQDQLKETADRLNLTVDYGKLTVFSQPLFWLLDFIHGFVGNWGWAIVIMTILIKLLFYPLAERSGRSMAKMRKLAPRLKQIQERYKDDRQKLSQEMMALYKREGANPFAGCWPVLIQMPVFLALYWVLIESVELRQAPFIGWIQDLSSRDPYFVLPVLMMGAMFASTKMNPTPPDPIQAKVMTYMPLAFGAFFALFPAGLVLYWFINTLLTALQQWRINRVVGA